MKNQESEVRIGLRVTGFELRVEGVCGDSLEGWGAKAYYPIPATCNSTWTTNS